MVVPRDERDDGRCHGDCLHMKIASCPWKSHHAVERFFILFILIFFLFFLIFSCPSLSFLIFLTSLIFLPAEASSSPPAQNPPGPPSHARTLMADPRRSRHPRLLPCRCPRKPGPDCAGYRARPVGARPHRWRIAAARRSGCSDAAWLEKRVLLLCPRHCRSINNSACQQRLP